MHEFIFSKMHAPRWLVLLIDIHIVLVSISIAYILRFNFNATLILTNDLYYAIPMVIFVRTLTFLITKTYAGLVRYTSTRDALRIFIVGLSGSLILFGINIIQNLFFQNQYFIPYSVLLIEFVTTVFIMIISRFVVKTFYFEYSNRNETKEFVVIYGANQLGLATKRTIERDAAINYRVVAFIDSRSVLVGKNLDAIKIYHAERLTELIERFKITNLVFSNPDLEKIEKQEIIDICLNHNVKVLRVPKLQDWINGELSINQIKNIKIEDLLERDPIVLDEKQIKKEIVNKVVMVTGAAGSIGSEIVRQLTRFNPKLIILYDQAESPLYDVELELREKLNFYNFEIVIGSVTNEVRLKKTFETYKPTVVYHAAAYKHVPMMENNPSESVRTNVAGTKLLADLSVKYNVNKFVMISTDKAVNPTNVMGASKRIAEIYIQSLNTMFQTNFITTRFGNVLGSNGSVIPRFQKQIESGGPVTVTHPEITRYFMTIPEACQLVLEAGAHGNGGEIFIFDMGKSVKITDLARKMIKLSGLELGKDIQIQFTGLRPGEKLYEELLNDKENTVPTHHPQIMVAKVRTYNFEIVANLISELINSLIHHDNFEIVGIMKRIVPEFHSENSVYEELDMNNQIELNDIATETNSANYIDQKAEIENQISEQAKPNGKLISLIH